MPIYFRFTLIFLLFFPQKSIGASFGDSTRKGLGKAKIDLFFKRYFDFNNQGASKRYRKADDKSYTRLAFPFESGQYELKFEDNFDSLNPAVWAMGQPWGRFHSMFPHQYYSDSDAYAKNGKLHLRNRYAPKILRDKDSNYQCTYATGLINTYYSNNFTHGYFAIRSKNPHGPATWPAFWLTGKYHWPPEIDIFEMYGHCQGNDIHTQTMSMHFGKIETHTKTSLTKSVNLSPDTDTSFHIYSCLWEPARVQFFTDGVLLKTIKLSPWMQQFYLEPMYIILNNAVDHNYLNCIHKQDLPNEFVVDWIRVYQKKN
jgi:beta-glucanase (GH16 family)